MNIQQLRHSLKVKWLIYYRQNRPWLVQLGVWGTHDGQRRPCSSFILATLSILEPQLTQMFPFIIHLSNKPDRIVAALGLNFNPDEELKLMNESSAVAMAAADENGESTKANGNGKFTTKANGNGKHKNVHQSIAGVNVLPSSQTSNLPSWVDESCRGVGGPSNK